MSRLLVIVLVLSAAGWWFWGRTVAPARVVHAHLEALSHHDYEKAYSYLSIKAKGRLSLDAFRELVNRNPVVADNYTADFLDRKMENNILTMSGYVRAFNSEKVPATYIVVKEGGRWAIHEFRF